MNKNALKASPFYQNLKDKHMRSHGHYLIGPDVVGCVNTGKAPVLARTTVKGGVLYGTYKFYVCNQGNRNEVALRRNHGTVPPVLNLPSGKVYFFDTYKPLSSASWSGARRWWPTTTPSASTSPRRPRTTAGTTARRPRCP